MGRVEVPTRQHGPEAYVPAEPDEEDWPPPGREAVIEQARRARSEEAGLAVDDATLERVADAVMDPAYPARGSFFTAEECAELEGSAGLNERIAAIETYLRRHPDIHGGLWVGWRDGRRTVYVGIAGDAEPHRAALSELGGDRIALEAAPRTLGELDALRDRIDADRPALRVAGFEVAGLGVDPQRGVVDVQVIGGRDAAAAEQELAARYGEAAAVEWLGPSSFREVPHPFGSWTSEGRLVRVFFGLDHTASAAAPLA